MSDESPKGYSIGGPHGKQWIEITMPLSFDEVNSFFGPKCETYNPSCACCIAWKDFYENHQMVTVVITRQDVINALTDNPSVKIGKIEKHQ